MAGGIKREGCDDWFSKCVRKRANWRSEYSGQEGVLHCCHIYGRRGKSVRWDGMNAVCLTAHEHRHFTENPLEFHRWLEKHLGQGHLDILREKKNTLMKTNKQLRREIAAHYRQQFNEMQDGEDFISWS